MSVGHWLELLQGLHWTQRVLREPFEGGACHLHI